MTTPMNLPPEIMKLLGTGMPPTMVLDDKHNIVPCPDYLAWCTWMFGPGDHKRVAFDEVGEVGVSTIFLGFDHSFGRGSRFFETMILGGAFHETQWRTDTWDNAMIQHREAVATVRRGQIKASP